MSERMQAGRAEAVTPLVVVCGTVAEILALFAAAAPQPDCAYLLVLPAGEDAAALVERQPDSRLLGEDAAIEPGRLIVLPANRWAMPGDRRLRASTPPGDEPDAHGRLDTLLGSASLRQPGRTAVILLSALRTDGLLGVVALAEAGTLVVIVTAETEPPGGEIGRLLEIGAARGAETPEAIAGLLARHFDPGAAAAAPSPADGPLLTAIRGRLGRITALDLEAYKPRLLAHAAETRRRALGLPDLAAYSDRLRGDRDEARRLLDAFLIGVTGFHRDPSAFAALRAGVLDPLVAGIAERKTLRVWIPGCATGEEAYSVAMELDDALRAAGAPGDFRVIATDVNSRAVEIASEGRFSVTAAAALPAHLAQRYLQPEGDPGAGIVSIVPQLRRHLIFAQHDVLSEAPFLDLDLIVCRNLLIYLRSEPRARVLSMLRFGLRPGGYLMLGKCESPSALEEPLHPVDRRSRIFRRAGTDGATAPGDGPGGRRIGAPGATAGVASELRKVRDRGVLLDAYGALLNRYAPPSILLTGEGQVLNWFGAAKLFVSNAQGAGAGLIEDVLHPDLGAALRDMLGQLLGSGELVATRDIGLRVHADESQLCFVKLETIHRLSGDWLLMATLRVEGCDPLPAAAGVASDADLSARLVELEQELRLINSASRRVVDRLEASSEELQLSNEELRASNQDLRASNRHLHSANNALQKLNLDLLATNGSLLSSREVLGHDLELAGRALAALGATALVVDRAQTVTRVVGAARDITPGWRGTAPGVALAQVIPARDAPDLGAAIDRVLGSGQPATCAATLNGTALSLRIEPVAPGLGHASVPMVMVVLPGPA
ncbi:CheR family methyltransferase [Mesobacterium pallidum]|uniref:CheR family methyltransferase n=1 Tax=Mesobacterium pallidum TaxID=2872037 RepID=UPI001EE31A3C|nr:protein-glutamate O-methyltransferase CheR [Mesobacterium pallidum]